MIEAGTEQEGKMKKRILSFILCIAILCSNSGLTYAADFTQAKSGEESLPFTFLPTKYGVENADVLANKLEITDSDTWVEAVIDQFLLVLRQEVDDAFANIYLVGHSGLIKKFTVSTKDENWIADNNYGWLSSVPAISTLRSAAHFQESYSEVNKDEYCDTLYKILNPDTGKYDVLNASTGAYYEYGLDDIYSLAYYGKPTRSLGIIKDGKYGLMNLHGEIIYETKYEEIRAVAGVTNAGVTHYISSSKEHGQYKQALFNDAGSLSGEYLYESVQSYEDDTVVICETDDGYGVLDAETGEELAPCSFNKAYYMGKGTVALTQYIYESADGQDKNRWQTCLVSRSGITALNVKYGGEYSKVLDTPKDGVCGISIGSMEKYDVNDYGWWAWGEKPSFMGAMDHEGNQMFPYDEGAEYENYGGNYWLKKVRDTSLPDDIVYDYTVLDRKGNVIWSLGKGRSVSLAYCNERYLYVTVNDMEGRYFAKIYDTAGKKLVFDQENVSPTWVNESIWQPTEHLIELYKNNEGTPEAYGLFNTQNGKFSGFNRETSTFSMDDWKEYVNEEKCLFYDPGQDKIMDEDFEIVLDTGDIPYGEIHFTDKGNIAFTGGGSYIVYDMDGRPLSQYIQDRYTEEGWYRCMDLMAVSESEDGFMGFCDKEGNMVIEPQYEDVSDMRYGMAFVMNSYYDHSESGVINKNGEYLIKGNYGRMSNSQNYQNFLNCAVLILPSSESRDIYYFYDLTENIRNQKNTLGEEELFGAYHDYLDNPFYKSMQSSIYDAAAEVLASRTDEDDCWSALKTLFSGGTVRALKEILGGYSGANFSEKEIEDQVAVELVRQIGNSDSIAEEAVSDLNNTLEWTDKIYTILSKASASRSISYQEKLEVAKAVANPNLTVQASKIIEKVEEEWESIDQIFKKAGVVGDFLSVSVTVITLVNLQYEVVTKLLDVTLEGSSFYNGLKRLQKRLGGDYVVDEFMKKFGEDEVWELLAKGIASTGAKKVVTLFAGGTGLGVSSALALAEAGFWIVGTCMPSPSYDDLIKANFSMSAAAALGNALANERRNIASHYKKTGTSADKAQRKRYKFIYNAYVTALKVQAENLSNIAVDGKKDTLQFCIDKFAPKLTYKKYINSCLKNMNLALEEKYVYKLNEDGTAVITGIEQNAAYSARSISPGGDLISIPETIGGHIVTGVDGSAFFGSSTVEGILLPDTVLKIGENAFGGCERLNTVFLGNQTAEIGANAFAGCSALSDVRIPGSVEAIGEKAFADCENLVLVCPTDSLAQNYAQKNEISTRSEKKSLVNLELYTQSYKQAFLSSEPLDLTGLSLKAVYEDGSSEIVTEGFTALTESRQAGQNTVQVIYGGKCVSYQVEITADPQELETYEIRYEDETGAKLAPGKTAQAMFGSIKTEFAVGIPGYIPTNEEIQIRVGSSEEWVFVYIEKKRLDIEETQIYREIQYEYTGLPITPVLALFYNGQELIQGRDYRMDMENNIEVGTGQVRIWGVGEYSGVMVFNFYIENPDDQDQTDSPKTDPPADQNQPKPQKPVLVRQIRLSGISKQIAAGKKFTLKASVCPANASSKVLSWKSSNLKVAAVNSKGVVTMKRGSGGKKVTITAQAKDGSGVKAVYKLTSMKGVVKKITVSGTKSVKAGKSLKLKAKVKASKKANTKLKWSSSNTKYAAVGSTGKVKTKKAGKGKRVKITAWATDGSGKKKTVTLRIR